MPGAEQFENRQEAGRLLAAEVLKLGLSDPVVLALPRGGVPVAAEVACALRAPLGLVLVRKIGLPGQPEVAMAAVAAVPGQADPLTAEVAVDASTLLHSGVGQREVEARLPQAVAELERRQSAYLRNRAVLALQGRTVVLVDDGIATGTTLRAALRAIAAAAPRRCVVAVPVAPPEAITALRGSVDAVVCLQQPPWFRAVGAHYRHFEQLEDAEVIALLDQAEARMAAAQGAARPTRRGPSGAQ